MAAITWRNMGGSAPSGAFGAMGQATTGVTNAVDGLTGLLNKYATEQENQFTEAKTANTTNLQNEIAAFTDYNNLDAFRQNMLERSQGMGGRVDRNKIISDLNTKNTARSTEFSNRAKELYASSTDGNRAAFDTFMQKNGQYISNAGALYEEAETEVRDDERVIADQFKLDSAEQVKTLTRDAVLEASNNGLSMAQGQVKFTDAINQAVTAGKISAADGEQAMEDYRDNYKQNFGLNEQQLTELTTFEASVDKNTAAVQQQLDQEVQRQSQILGISGNYSPISSLGVNELEAQEIALNTFGSGDREEVMALFDKDNKDSLYALFNKATNEGKEAKMDFVAAFPSFVADFLKTTKKERLENTDGKLDIDDLKSEFADYIGKHKIEVGRIAELANSPSILKLNASLRETLQESAEAKKEKRLQLKAQNTKAGLLKPTDPYPR